VVAQPCEVSWELVESLDSVCVAPLWLGGLRGKKSTPSISWEVSVKSRWSASGSCKERAGCHSERAIKKWYAFFICMVDCCGIHDLELHVYFGR
jgi:hypothetical protein